MANPKHKCGTILGSYCVPHAGPDLTFLPEGETLECNASIADVIVKINAALTMLVDGFKFSELEIDCLELEDDFTHIELHQAEISKICENAASIAGLQEQFNDWDISEEVITIDLPECLEEASEPCAVGTNQYQLINLLMAMANKICDLETRISNLES